ncbi:MAG TPA: protein kinase [Candidatus Nanoarchaeia archaeon]|nr:protein kinase [Candidatus Nanoarchaeia archaeon]
MVDRSKPDLYAILEVNPRARTEVIDAAYKALMKQYHPDINQDDSKGSSDIARQLNEARTTLLNPNLRSKYDSSRNILNKGGNPIINGYRFLEKIAEGGFGPTFKAEHVESGLPVCVKVGHQISPQHEQVLRDEARAIWDLRHYGIPVMRDMFKTDDQGLFLVMSYIPGPTLEKVVQKAGNGLDPEHVAWITERTLNVLMYLHYHGVVHGDVKPQNIIIQPEKHELVLVDYGLSAIRPEAKAGSKGHTELFSSPEQLKGLTILPQSDFYSLAMTMIYALGGDMNTKRVPESTPNPMCNFIARCLVRDVLSRPDWNSENLFESFKKVRTESFGRSRSAMKPLPGA